MEIPRAISSMEGVARDIRNGLIVAEGLDEKAVEDTARTFDTAVTLAKHQHAKGMDAESRETLNELAMKFDHYLGKVWESNSPDFDTEQYRETVVQPVVNGTAPDDSPRP